MTDVLAEDVRLDDENPWPGLGPFDEAAQRFFNGREAETAALRRLVLEAPVTVLFSRSGLGKTSLLKAGLFPQIRLDHCLPVYVRLDVRDREQPLVEQIARALSAEIASCGAEVAPARGVREALWHYLHRSDLELWSSQNHPLTPLIVLDQFEEVFTLGVGNAAAVDQFRVDLGDLVENRIPASLSRENEKSEAASRDLDLQRQRYKVLLSLREDFLPAIEGWKSGMPSVMRNRLRLMPLDGRDAFDAVHKTAPVIAPSPIARKIVSVVATAHGTGNGGPGNPDVAAGDGTPETTVGDGADLDGLEVEPALLSLVCRRLNERRQRAGRKAFDETLLTGAVPAILDEFYRSCLEDQPDRLKRFVAEGLVTEGGFRNLYAVDDARRAYGITDDELRTLVNRRLLRVEPYQGVDRIELIHDVLTPRVREERERFRAEDRTARAETEARQERKRQKFRQLALGLVGVVVLTIVTAALGVRAAVQGRTAEARRIAAVASARIATNPEMAALLALSSLDLKLTTEAEGVLRRALFRVPLARLEGQKQPIRRVAFSPDGQRLAATAAGGSTWVWQAGNRWVPRGMQFEGSHGDAVDWSPDGKLLATAGEKVMLWDSLSGAKIRDLEAPAQASTGGDPRRRIVSVLAFDPSGSSLAAAWDDGQIITVWRLSDYSVTRVFDVAGEDLPIPALLFSPDAKQLIAASARGTLLTWNLQDQQRRPGTVSLRLELPLSAAALSPTGATMAIAGGIPPRREQRGSGFARLVRLADGETMRELHGGHDGEVVDIAISADGRTVISAGLDGTICTWDATRGSLISEVRAHAGAVRSLSVAPGGDVFASGGDDQIARVWSSAPLPDIALEGHQDQVTSVAFSSDGDSVVTGGMDGTVRLWSAVDGTPIHTLRGHRDQVYAVALSPDGRLIASAGGSVLGGASSGTGSDTSIRFWNRHDGTLAREILDNREDVIAAAFSSDGRALATAGAFPAIRFWDVGTGRLIRELRWPAGASVALSFSPGGELLAAAGDDGVVRVWEQRTGKPITELRQANALPSSAVFGRGGSRLLTTSFDNSEIVVWDVRSGSVVQRFAGRAGANNADFSWSGVLAVTAETDSAPKLWDVSNGSLLASLVPAQATWSVAFSPDMRRIAAGSSDGKAHVWSCQICGAPVAELEDIARRRIGRTLGKVELQTLLAE